MMAAASMAHDNGFHIYPKKTRMGFRELSGSLFGPYWSRRFCHSALERPFSSHCKPRHLQSGQPEEEGSTEVICTPLSNQQLHPAIQGQPGAPGRKLNAACHAAKASAHWPRVSCTGKVGFQRLGRSVAVLLIRGAPRQLSPRLTGLTALHCCRKQACMASRQQGSKKASTTTISGKPIYPAPLTDRSPRAQMKLPCLARQRPGVSTWGYSRTARRALGKEHNPVSWSAKISWPATLESWRHGEIPVSLVSV